MTEPQLFNKPILGGHVFSKNIDDWQVTWESNQGYRHWCFQQFDESWKKLLIVMLNPGSLDRAGSNLAKDTTLKVLRSVCIKVKVNPFIINLFDYADPKPENLYNNWKDRDSSTLVINNLNAKDFSGVVYAYGDFEAAKTCKPDIEDRIVVFKHLLSQIPTIPSPTNKSGNPRHPLNWQRFKQIEEMQLNLIKAFF
jgi:hypothetical protein